MKPYACNDGGLTVIGVSRQGEPINKPYEWTHSETIGLASVRCVKCNGTGLMPGPHRTGKAPCNCVLRNIFRQCMKAVWKCEDPTHAHYSRVIYAHGAGKDETGSWTRVSQNYVADAWLIAKRTLDEFEFKIYRLHFLCGADWKACCRTLKIDRGTFFHAVYRVEQKLGRAYREVRPYSLYPPDEYFGGTIRKVKIAATEPAVSRKRIVRPPYRPPVEVNPTPGKPLPEETNQLEEIEA